MWNHSFLKTAIHLSYIVNKITANGPVVQGARASTSLPLTQNSWNILLGNIFMKLVLSKQNLTALLGWCEAWKWPGKRRILGMVASLMSLQVSLATTRETQLHYIDVIMTTMASQITSLTVVYSTVYSDVDQRKHQSSASMAFVWGIHRDRWIPRTKGQLRGKCFHLMTSSWCTYFMNDFANVLWYIFLLEIKLLLLH